MSGSLGDKQKRMLARAYDHEQRHGGEPSPIAQVLDEAFVSYSNRFDTDKYAGRWRVLDKSERFQARRAIRALINRGLMAEAGTAVSRTGGDAHVNSGRYCPKGYTRVCKTYRLTKAGRAIGKVEDEASAARLRAMEEADPKLKQIAKRAKAALANLGR
jgi:hypothetical protein